MTPKEERWHDQWIAAEEGVLNGKPHVRGTQRTVAEVQAVWKEPGVYAAQLREAFPDLTEAQLGAAVTWAPAPIIDHSFVAEWEGPPKRHLYVWSERSAADDERRFRGWSFAYEEMNDAGEWESRGDNWEESLHEILRYPADHAPRDITWRDKQTGEVVDIYALTMP